MYELASTLENLYDFCVFHVPLSDSEAKISLSALTTDEPTLAH